MENLVVSLAQKYVNILGEGFVQDIIDLTENREEQIALENLCEQLIEFDVKLDEKTLFSLSKIISFYNSDKGYIKLLSP